MPTETIKEIKRSFRTLMNGVTAQSMRDKGVDYHINWGASLGHLREMAEEYGKNEAVATGLWKEDVRECKILATLMMPAESFAADMALLWIEQLRSQEMAEMLALNLLQYIPEAQSISLQMLAEEAVLPRICAYTTLGHLFRRKIDIDERDINEYLDQALTVMRDEASPLPLRHSVLKSLQHFSEISDTHCTIARNLLNTIGLEDMV